MTNTIKIAAIFLVFILPSQAFSQKPQFSLATDLSVLHSFKKEQRYWAIGQTIDFHFHFTPRDGFYAWFCYFSNGRFSNDLMATAKSGATLPQEINYRNNAQLNFRHMSMGWKHYLQGNTKAENGWNLYYSAGFGLMFGHIVNNQSVNIDTSVYILPVLSGNAHFKRLTFDLGLGLEFPVGGDIYLYGEGRLLVPASDYPSKYLLINNNAPLNGTGNIGLRILFD